MSSSAALRSPKIIFGLILLLSSVYLLVRLFRDPVSQEIRYATTQANHSLSPPNTDFSLVITKINASAAIIPNVDPFNSQLYQLALRDGVAHAKGTKLPGEGGNIFLFAHSSADLLTAERYNSVFYLIHHLEPEDQIKIWYQSHEYNYFVTEKHIVSPNDTKYMTNSYNSETLTLMTCWPPGTTLKRLIVIAKPK